MRTLCLPSHTFHTSFVAHAWQTSPKAHATPTNPHVLVQTSWRCAKAYMRICMPRITVDFSSLWTLKLYTVIDFHQWIRQVCGCLVSSWFNYHYLCGIEVLPTTSLWSKRVEINSMRSGPACQCHFKCSGFSLTTKWRPPLGHFVAGFSHCTPLGLLYCKETMHFILTTQKTQVMIVIY